MNYESFSQVKDHIPRFNKIEFESITIITEMIR